MRPDEYGCADLRRSLAAHLKVVRRLTYAPARKRSPRAGAREARGCARDVSVALAGTRRPARRARHGRDVTGSALATAHRPATSHSRFRRPWPESAYGCLRHGGSDGPGLPECEFLPLAQATTKPPPHPTGRHDEGGVSWHTGGVRGALHGGQGIGHCGNSRLIGALTYDTYARAAAPASHGGRPPCGPSCTRA